MSEIERLEEIVDKLKRLRHLIHDDGYGTSFLFVLESKIRAYGRRIRKIKECGC